MTFNKTIKKMLPILILQIAVYELAMVCQAVIPVFNKYLVNYLSDNKFEYIYRLILLYLLCYGLYYVFIWLSERLNWKAYIRFEYSLKSQAFNKLSEMDYMQFSKKKKEEHISLLTNQITQVGQDYFTPMIALIKAGISVAVYVGIIYAATSPLICIVILSLSLFATFSPMIYKSRLKVAGKDFLNSKARYLEKISDLLSGFDLVDSISRNGFVTKHAQENELAKGAHLKYGKSRVTGNLISGIAVGLISIIIFILCVALYISGNISLGIVVAAISYAQSLTEPLNELLYDINTRNSAKDVKHDLDSFFDEENLSKERRKYDGEISLENERITYPQRELMYNAKFNVGQKYVIYGASGSGKSTLFNLLTGRLDENIIGEDGNYVPLSPDDFCYIKQDEHIFSENINENITLFDSYIHDFDELIELFSELPQFKTISESVDCSKLSGGEKQFINIARIFSLDKKIIFLDEPFSAMDINMRKAVIRLLSELDKTIFLITHDYNKDDFAGWNFVDIADIT